MLHRLEAILQFYKPYVLWSFAVTICVLIINPFIFYAIVTKFFLTLFLWFYVKETKRDNKLRIFKNMGIASHTLFLMIFLIDIFFTVLFMTLLKAYL
jgi:hypothetical protein